MIGPSVELGPEADRLRGPMKQRAGADRKTIESKVLAVLAEYIPTWERQHVALGRIMGILYPENDPGAHEQMLSTLSDIMQLDPVLNRARLEKLASTMVSLHYDPDQLRKVYRLSPESPWGGDWRSEGGRKPPTERGLRDTVSLLCRKHKQDQVVDLDSN